MPKNESSGRFWMVLLVMAVLALAGGGCARFAAVKPLQEQLDSQFANFPRATGALLTWCVDEWQGDPSSLGP